MKLPAARALVHSVPTGGELMSACEVEPLLLCPRDGIPVGHKLMVRHPPHDSLFYYERSAPAKPVDASHVVPVKPGGLETGTLTWCKKDPARGFIRVTCTPDPKDAGIQGAKFELVARPSPIDTGAGSSAADGGADALADSDTDGGEDELNRLRELEVCQHAD